MIRCNRCVMPNTRPDTPFIDGVCGACINHEKAQEKPIDWSLRELELRALIEAHTPNGSGYDMIVPSSGGKDSTRIVLTLKEMGYKPLVVTAATCLLTPIGHANILNLAEYADTIEVTPNMSVRKKLMKLGLTLVGDGSWSEHVAIFNLPFKVAIRYGIPLLFYGENPQQQYGGPPGSEEAKQLTRRWTSEFGGQLGLRPSDMVDQLGITAQDMEIYEPPKAEELEQAGIQAHFLGAYMPWDSIENAQIANEHGMRQILPCPQNYWISENQDSYLTGPLHDYFMMLKFGYGRGCMQASIDARTGRSKREDALQFVEERDSLWPRTYMGLTLEQILDRAGITQREFLMAANNFMNKDLFVEQYLDWGRKLTLK